MTPREFCQPQAAEHLKGAVHVLLMVTAGACLAYNAAALLWRHERHLMVNVCVYGTLVAFEAEKVRKHWSRP